MFKTKNLIMTLVVVIALIFAGLYFVDSEDRAGGAFWETETFIQGLQIGQTGDTLNEYKCHTSSWNPGSVSSSTAPATLDISTPGYDVGNEVFDATFHSSTSTDQWTTYGDVTNTGTTTIYLEGISGSAVDLSSETAEVCTAK